MRRLMTFVVAALLGASTIAAAQQSVNITVGGFSPSGTQSSNGVVSNRAAGDILVANSDFGPGRPGFLDFNLGDFRGPTIGAEYLFGIGDKFEGGVGVGFYKKTAVGADHYKEFQNTGDPILADLRLRLIPISATFRFLPLGHHGVEPYIGGGVGVFAYHYSESGDFVASDNVTIFRNTFEGGGAATGPVVLGGVRVPVGSVRVGGELRWQRAIGDLPTDQGFATARSGATPQIDLGGWTYSLTLNFRF
jgi:hypothetical protein